MAELHNVVSIAPAMPTSDGAGVKIKRNVAQGNLREYDPFLMLDEIASDDAADYIAGFPEHPHRGFETVTYMLEGSMLHRDHLGNEGHLETGGVQWMTAGRGVLHSEMPQQDNGLMHGFQLWINLPASEKMKPAAYQEFDAKEIPEVNLSEQSLLRVVAGDYEHEGEKVTGPIKGISTEPVFYDLRLAAGEAFETQIASDRNIIVYVVKGAVSIQDMERSVPEKHLIRLTGGEALKITAESDALMLIIAGKPIGEPIVNYGPFVMNTKEEIEQAMMDYRTGALVNY